MANVLIIRVVVVVEVVRVKSKEKYDCPAFMGCTFFGSSTKLSLVKQLTPVSHRKCTWKLLRLVHVELVSKKAF